MRGEGPYAQQIATTLQVFAKRYGLDQRLPALSGAAFRPPRTDNQLRLFESE
jgi:hypothetical protein